MIRETSTAVNLQFCEKLIIIENGEIVFARLGSDRFDEYHDLKRNRPDWDKVRTILYVFFNMRSMQEDLDKAMTYLSKGSQGYAILEPMYREEAKKLSNRLATINSLLEK